MLSTAATVYVTESMTRFLTEQHAESLPVGCMLGYSLDGHLPFAQSCIAGAIGRHTPLAIAEGPTNLNAIDAIGRFGTLHMRRAGSELELRHALFSRPRNVPAEP